PAPPARKPPPSSPPTANHPTQHHQEAPPGMLPTRVERVPTDGIVDAVGKAVPTGTTVSIT
ncbi:hypothetical protein, partial [Arthrobacter sp. M2012083]|uniref:hypothetical protein n=1 Tax=Arthrobacter sp. M2012083 TaxID=1197706 RepID=UPI0025710DD3